MADTLPEDQSTRDYLHRRLNAAKQERASFDPHIREIAEKVNPRRSRFQTSDRNKGEKRYQKIINSRATRALRIATAGMHAGIMSPARPWFELATPDPDMMEYLPVKVWLSKVTAIINTIFADSNLYNMAPVMLKETLLFGTGFMLHVNDFDDVARFYTQTFGAYVIAQNHRLSVDTAGREFEMTARNMAQQFGKDNLSQAVKNVLDKHEDAWIPVAQWIEPNPEYKMSSPFSKHMRWRSIYWEPGNTDRKTLLQQGGFKSFPAYGLRWEVTGEDVYGTDCPGMIGLGDTNQLQIEEKRKAQAIDKHVNPPLKGPPELKGNPVSGLPGGLTIYSGDDRANGLRPIYEVKPDLAGLLLDIKAVEARIDDCFFVQLFKPITNMEGIQPKNIYDLTQRNQEALQELGPTLQRFHGELLSPLINRAFDQALAADILPPPPPELEGMPLKINYVSALAMAMRAVAANGIDRLSGYVGGLVQAGLSDGLKFDGDQAIDEMAQVLGAPPRIIVPDEFVQKRRAERERQKQMEQAALMAQSLADTTKKLSDTRPQDGNDDSVLAKISKGVRGVK